VRYWVEQFSEAVGDPELWMRVALLFNADAP
jgi:hypothetical protein